MISIAETKARGWFLKYFTKAIHYYSGGRALCHKRLKLTTDMTRTELKEVDSRPCKTCVKRLSDWSDLDNFDEYYSD